jgi:deoxyribose-phosphate aldolase
MKMTTRLNDYIDATYLITSKKINCSKEELIKKNIEFVNDILPYQVKAIILRPNMLKFIKPILIKSKSKSLLGTVIDFPKGSKGLEYKLRKAQKAIDDGADELDFVCNYKKFQNNYLPEFIKEIIECTKLVLNNKKTIKWIIETAALSSKEIVKITALIKNTIVSIFKEDQLEYVFVKSSTGYFKTKDNLPNGATLESITLMLENAYPLKIKASGGIKKQEDALRYIKMGVSRIGTSSVLSILNNQSNDNNQY